METTIAAIATAPGQGGLAVIRLSGPHALQIAGSFFIPKNPKKTLDKLPGYMASYGTLFYKDEPVDEVVVLVFRAPHSYTGEDVVEISCHGGDIIAAEILDICISYGAKMASGGEFTKRAFMNGKLSLSEAEAVVKLISASTAQEAACAKRVLQGNKINQLNLIKNNLKDIAAHLVAWMDYPEEDVPPPEEELLREKIHQCRLDLDRILEEYQKAMRIKRGVKVVICGPPNVGKSTIFNLLVGCNRAITTPIAGTTRDVLHEEIQLAGYPVLLTDTAGLRESANLVEAEGIRRSGAEIESADLLVYIREQGSTELPIEQIAELKNKPSLCIYNKSDLRSGQKKIGNSGKEDINWTKRIEVSALMQPELAMGEIQTAMQELLALQAIEPDAMLLCSKRQQEKAIQAQEALLMFERQMQNHIIYDITLIYIENALEALMELSGENVTEAIIEEVFEQFCVGK